VKLWEDAWSAVSVMSHGISGEASWTCVPDTSKADANKMVASSGVGIGKEAGSHVGLEPGRAVPNGTFGKDSTTLMTPDAVGLRLSTLLLFKSLSTESVSSALGVTKQPQHASSSCMGSNT
jgi:hypothetical protein